MSKKSGVLSSNMVATKNKHKVISCSTPEHGSESPSRDSDSLCESDAASPVPFLCTQDGAEGETDVVWNFYTPKSDHAPSSRFKNSTPLSTNAKKKFKHKVIEKPLPRKRTVRPSQMKTELFQDLLELNQNLHELIAKKSNKEEKPLSGSEEDIFSDSRDSSPKSGRRTNSRCLRRNVLSSKFAKPEPEAALESDDSMNECLVKASQVVEEKILYNEPIPAKRPCHEPVKKPKAMTFNIDNDSMDAILNNINLNSPAVKKINKFNSPKLNNDSFDNLVGNLNDSDLERLTQAPASNMNVSRNKLNSSKTDWTIKELVVHDGSPANNKSLFGRHNSMPESPSVLESKPSTSGMTFGRYNSMPHKNDDSPIRCTPEEIKKKHQQAREKLLAKRLLPFTSSQQQCTEAKVPMTQKKVEAQATKVFKRTEFKPRVPSSSNVVLNQSEKSCNTVDIKVLIERKRQEALLKLRKRLPQNKT